MSSAERRGRRGLIAGLVSVGAGALLAASWGLWLPLIGRFLVVADPLRPADAVVALAPAKERVVHGAGLFKRGYADWYVVVETPISLPGIREGYAELARREAIWQGVPEERILQAPGVARTTYEEGLRVRELARERGWRSLIVVTDPYHTRRARMIFRDLFRGGGVAVTVRPVPDGWYRAEAWWRTPEGLRETWTEYVKMLVYVVGYDNG